MIQRDIYDAQNLGRFHRCYPSADPVSIPGNNRLGIANEVRRAAQPRVSAVERVKWHQACLKCLNSSKSSSRRSHQHNIHEQKQSTRLDTYKIRVTTSTVLVVDPEMEAFVEFSNSFSHAAIQYDSNNKRVVVQASQSRDASYQGESVLKCGTAKQPKVIRPAD